MDFFWPVLAIVYQGWTLTLPGVVIFALAVGLPRRRSEDLYSSRQLALAALLVFPITIVSIGAAFWHEDSHSFAPRWPAIILSDLWLAHVVVAVYLVMKFDDVRVRAAIAGISSVWVSTWVVLISVMAVTNDWI